jgi:hypothetical protein
MLEMLLKAEVAPPGNGLDANSVEPARKMGITVWTIG